MSRRDCLKMGGLALGFAAAPAIVGRAAERRVWRSDPFSLGVASGAPLPDGFVLWTRLVPEPENYDPQKPAGMSGASISVAYEIASDPEMRRIVRRGNAVADAQFGYSVHLEVSGLKPHQPYWYRFMSGDAQSSIGRATTLPAFMSATKNLRFGFVSCSNYEHGFFSAYRHLADEDPELVCFLGDYIYEYADTRPEADIVRKHSEGRETEDLAGYRNRYAQYRLDPDLKHLHAATTALMTWDDHEVQNDYANETSEDFIEPAVFLHRRAQAYQAYYEHMPLRASARPNGASMRIYDRVRYGDLVDFSILDGRQYRSRQACYRIGFGGGHFESDASCPERLDGGRSMIGQAQEAWLFDGLSRSRARWNVIAQDVLMAQLKVRSESGEASFSTDAWDGYPASRKRLLQHVHDSGVANPVVIGGDIHSYWANDLKLDFDDPSSPTVATEFVGTSITSHPPPYEFFVKTLPDNPHVRFMESRVRGYVSVDLSPERMTTRLRRISDAKDPNASVSTLKTFVVESGNPGAIEA
ncbi:MAG TPA: alkaline phosphatase D family protein [Micropepsaceae bacterium]|nr:alkaline phosphatase D family protein [Micropepsaceae bacterium]